MKHTVLTIALLAAALALWQLRSQEPPVAAAAAAPASDAAPAATGPVSAGALQAPPTPATPAAESPFETVLGIEVRKDRNCTVELRHLLDESSGELRELYVCTPHSLPEPDPYEAYPDDVLASMAYGDPHAAEVLGLKKLLSGNPREEAEGLQLLLRAVALSNDIQGITLALNHRFNHLYSNGTPHLENMKQLVVLGQISGYVQPGALPTGWYAGMLRKHGVDEHEIADLMATGRQIAEELAALQTEITGDVHIREALDENS